MCSLTLPQYTHPSLWEVIADHPLAGWVALSGTAPAHALPIYLPHEIEILVMSIAVPALGLRSRVLAPRNVRGRVDESALAVTRHAPPLPVCGLVDPGRSLMTTTGTDRCARALGTTVRGRDDCARDRLAVTRPNVTARSLGREVGGLDGVTGIAVRLLLLPTIAATLG